MIRTDTLTLEEIARRQRRYDPFDREPTCFSRWMNADRTPVRMFDL